MKRILSFLRPYRKQSILAPLFKMLEALFELFVPLVVASMIDRGIGQADTAALLRSSLLLLGLAVVGLVSSVTAQYFAAKAAVGMATELRSRLFGHILSLGYAEIDRTGEATLMTRMTSDVSQVQNGVNLVLRLFLRSPFIVFGAMVMAFAIDARIALIFAAAIALLALIVFGVMMLTRPLYQRVQGGLDGLLGRTRENLSGARVLRAFGREQGEQTAFEADNERLTLLQKHTGRLSALTNPLTLVVVNLAVILLVQKGALRVDAGVLTQGQVVALYNYMSQILVELIKLANLIVSVSKALACARRIDGLFDVQPAMREGAEQAGLPGAPAVEFRHACFAYEGAGAEALNDLSFRVERGQTVGIIGGTGSGKSTLVQLIPRFYDVTAGQVLLEGRDVRAYSDAALRRLVAVVPQKAQLFQGTIEENLRLGRDTAEPLLDTALSASQAREFVSQKEGGLAFPLEQGGRNLSGGQKQRLTIARALAQPADVLILDDSASALDYATDAKLRKALRELPGKPAVFIVSQRASSVRYADLILVLDEGRIAGMGTHDALLRDCAVYREIYESQFQKEARA